MLTSTKTGMSNFCHRSGCAHCPYWLLAEGVDAGPCTCSTSTVLVTSRGHLLKTPRSPTLNLSSSLAATAAAAAPLKFGYYNDGVIPAVKNARSIWLLRDHRPVPLDAHAGARVFSSQLRVRVDLRSAVSPVLCRARWGSSSRSSSTAAPVNWAAAQLPHVGPEAIAHRFFLLLQIKSQQCPN